MKSKSNMKSQPVHRNRPSDIADLMIPAIDRSNDSDLNDSMWAIHGKVNYFPCEKSVNVLPSEQYVFNETDNGVFLSAKNVNLDELILFPDGEFDEIMREIEKFWSAEDKFRKHGFLWKRGILLWGPPGSGKTSLVQIVSQMITNRGGVAVYADNPHVAARGLSMLRRVEPDRPIVVIMEDTDAIVNHFNESSVLALLDGELQIDNVLFIATTNYPENLDKRLINRPSRFDIIKKIGMPSAECREIYLRKKNPNLSDEEMAKWVAATKDFSLAHLREIIASVECLGNSFEGAVSRLRKMITDKPSSSEFSHATGVFGFTGNDQ
jgi:AAA+ superfamily predicted ATPase